MSSLIAVGLTWVALQSLPVSPGIHDRTLLTPGGTTITYAVSIPPGYVPQRPVPLILVLHSGGPPIPHYGREFMTFLAQPALAELGAILVAPDCPSGSWTDPITEQAVVSLMQQTMQDYSIDRRRVLVTGYSMGGRGTWFMASRHTELFTAAIPMAASTEGAAPDQMGTIPTYVIHSRDDEVVPFGPAERNAKQLAAMGRPVKFEALWRFTHFEMNLYADALKRGGRWVAEQWNRRQ
jgi:predicted peptidase